MDAASRIAVCPTVRRSVQLLPSADRSRALRRGTRALLWLACLLLSGCHVAGHPLEQVISAYDRGDVVAADESLNQLAERDDAEQDIVELDRAVIDLMAGRPQETLRTIEARRHRLRFLQQTDAREQAAAALKDDSQISWAGREFERRMLDNLQILAALLVSDDDAFALASRGMQSVDADRLALKESSENRVADAEVDDEGASEGVPSSPAQPTPFRFAANQMTAWLAAAVRSERMQDTDAARRLIRQAAAWDPSGEEMAAGLQLLGTGTSRNSGTLQVIVLADRVSAWEQERATPTSAALLAADRILSAIGDHTLPPTTSPVLIAKPTRQQYFPQYQTVVTADGLPARSARMMVDLNAAAWDSWQSGRDEQLARAVVRRVVKKGTVYGAKNALNVAKGSGADLLLNVAGSIWESREQADLRHWNLLPAAIEVAQLELPAGSHTVRLQVQPISSDGTETMSDQLKLPVVIDDGRNTFVVCFRLQGQLVGVQASQTLE